VTPQPASSVHCGSGSPSLAVIFGEIFAHVAAVRVVSRRCGRGVTKSPLRLLLGTSALQRLRSKLGTGSKRLCMGASHCRSRFPEGL